VLEDDPQRGYPHYVSAWLEMRAAGSERVDISARYCELLRDESYSSDKVRDFLVHGKKLALER
jgi:hypothetical protein